MPFSVREFRDLLRMLEKQPERRVELRTALLGEDVLALPQALRELAQAQTRTEQRLETLAARVDELAQAQARTEQRLEELAQAQTRTEQRLEQVAQAQVQMTEELAALTGQVRVLTVRVEGLLGESTERRYRERAPAYFDDLLRGLRVPSSQELAQILDQALDAGRISRAERKELLYTDVIAFGKRWEDGTETALAVEVSATVDEEDVRRAARRAELLARTTDKPATAVVAGEAIKPAADELARNMGVWRILDGRAFSPETPVSTEQANPN